MWLLKKKGSYVGRLAFDPDSGFHLAENGQRVVTGDAGKTWEYASRKDPSHQDRYHRNFLVVIGTTGEDPHHENPTADDAHLNGLVFTDDPSSAARETSHTEAYQ